jgi:CheY-like chemotaxis protein
MPRGLRQGSPRILVVDDNPANLDVISSMLRMVGFDVRTEPGVSRALEALAAQAFDLVIIDLVMPERDGLDFVRAVRTGEHTPDVPILVASASAFPEDQARSLAAGANGFVAKPVEAIPLLQKIGVLLALEFVYDEDVAAAPTAAAAERSDPPRLRGAAARRAVEGIREAAELGQIRLVSSLLEAVPAPDLRAELRRVLDRGLREHDADLILRDLEHACDDEGGEVPPRAASAA